jgi:hypothetical protein
MPTAYPVIFVVGKLACSEHEPLLLPGLHDQLQADCQLAEVTHISPFLLFPQVATLDHPLTLHAPR